MTPEIIDPLINYLRAAIKNQLQIRATYRSLSRFLKKIPAHALIDVTFHLTISDLGSSRYYALVNRLMKEPALLPRFRQTMLQLFSSSYRQATAEQKAKIVLEANRLLTLDDLADIKNFSQSDSSELNDPLFALLKTKIEGLTKSPTLPFQHDQNMSRWPTTIPDVILALSPHAIRSLLTDPLFLTGASAPKAGFVTSPEKFHFLTDAISHLNGDTQSQAKAILAQGLRKSWEARYMREGRWANQAEENLFSWQLKEYLKVASAGAVIQMVDLTVLPELKARRHEFFDLVRAQLFDAVERDLKDNTTPVEKSTVREIINSAQLTGIKLTRREFGLVRELARTDESLKFRLDEARDHHDIFGDDWVRAFLEGRSLSKTTPNARQKTESIMVEWASWLAVGYLQEGDVDAAKLAITRFLAIVEPGHRSRMKGDLLQSFRHYGSQTPQASVIEAFISSPDVDQSAAEHAKVRNAELRALRRAPRTCQALFFKL